MRCPSTKALVATFRNLSPKSANLVRSIAKAADDGKALATIIDKHCPRTAAYVRSMHSDPYDSKMWRATVALHAIDILVDGYGVEGIGPARGPSYAPPYEYVNMGDPYTTTLVYKRATDSLSLGSWGDIAEKHPSW